MKRFNWCKAIGVLLLVFIVGFSGCSLPVPPSSPPSDSSSIASSSLPPGPDAVREETYCYSTAVGNYADEPEYFFLYGPSRDDIIDAYQLLSQDEEEALPLSVSARPIPHEYEITFVGYGLLGGAVAPTDQHDARIDVSHDDGLTWEGSILPLSRGTRYTGDLAFGFTSSTEGWAVLSDTDADNPERPITVRFFATQDGGTTWQETVTHELRSFGGSYNNYESYQGLQAVLFLTAEHGFMAAQMDGNGPILETWDGGLTWQPCPTFIPVGFSTGPELPRAIEFLRGEEGISCVLEAVLQEDEHVSINIPLTPEQSGETTTWRMTGDWDFPPEAAPETFFSFIGAFDYGPGYYGVHLQNDYDAQYYLESGFFMYCRDYAREYKSNEIRTYEQYGEQYDIVPRQLVADLIALVYSETDFDVTTLSEYRADLDGFIIDPESSYYNEMPNMVYRSIFVTENGDIELIRDVTHAGYGMHYIKYGIWAQTQRCVFRPVTSASGAEMFTLVECENLDG